MNTRRATRSLARGVPIFVALATFAAFLPALHAGFVAWDDDSNFTGNLSYRGLGPMQLRWMWSTFLLGHYVPLTWMTLGADYLNWGMNAAGYHLTSLLLHSANAVLVYFVALRLLRRSDLGAGAGAGPGAGNGTTRSLAAGFAALVFSVHPLRVESVVWITERRDVLSGFFYLLSVLMYLRYCERAVTRRWYWGALGAFACALLSKGTAVTLVPVLLILNVFPLQRLGTVTGWWSAPARRVYGELIPFATLGASFVVMTFIALQRVDQLPPAEKVAVSAYSLAFYLWKTVAPVGLSPLYKMPLTIDPLGMPYLVSYAVAIGFAELAWSVRRSKPGVAAACVAFVVILLPLLGIHQNGPQIAADRYTYNAAIPLAIVAGAGWASMRRAAAPLAMAVAGGLVLALATLTWHQTLVWHDSQRLWTRVLALDPDSPIALTALGNLLAQEGKTDAAIERYEHSLALDPKSPEAENNLGIALSRQRRFADAIAHYGRAVALKPRYYEAENNWGLAIAEGGGSATAAIEHYQKALDINSDYADAHVNWGNALVLSDEFGDAISHYQQALRIRPDDADAERNWGVALARQQRFDEAVKHFERAVMLRPDFAEARTLLARARALQQKRGTERP